MASRRVDLSGQVFGTLKVLSYSHSEKVGTHTEGYWLCECECGAVVTKKGALLKHGKTKSCGAKMHNIEKWSAIGRLGTHLSSGSAEYKVWLSAKARCFNPKAQQYKNYGARGITMCHEWATSFEVFIRDVGPRPRKGMSIDRVDVNGNYEPGNVEWVDSHRQAQNKRVTKLSPEKVGIIRESTASAAELAEMFGVTVNHISRVRRKEEWANV